MPCFRVRRTQKRFLDALAGLGERSPAPRQVRDRVRKTLEAERRGT